MKQINRLGGREETPGLTRQTWEISHQVQPGYLLAGVGGVLGDGCEGRGGGGGCQGAGGGGGGGGGGVKV